MEHEDINNWFTYHSADAEQIEKYGQIRYYGRVLAEMIYALVPPGPDRSAAIRKVREAVMTANAGIACGGQG